MPWSDDYMNVVDLVDIPCEPFTVDPMLEAAEQFLARPLSQGEVLRVERWTKDERYPEAWIRHAFRTALEKDKRSLEFAEGVLKNVKRDGGLPGQKDPTTSTRAFIAARKSRDEQEAAISRRVDEWLKHAPREAVEDLARQAEERLPGEVPGARVLRRGYVRYLVAQRLGLGEAS